MKGYQIKDNNTDEFQHKVFRTLLGVKIHLGSYQWRNEKNWKDTLKERNYEVWEVEIKQIKKVL